MKTEVFFLNKIVYYLFLMRYKAKREHREKTHKSCRNTWKRDGLWKTFFMLYENKLDKVHMFRGRNRKKEMLSHLIGFNGPE